MAFCYVGVTTVSYSTQLMKKIIYALGLGIILFVAWLTLSEGSKAVTSPSGRFALELCEQPCVPSVTVLTEPRKGFKASCPLTAERQQLLLASENIEWASDETMLKFGDQSIDLRFDCYEAERQPSPTGQKTLIIQKNCLFGLDELQICRRALVLEKMSKAGDKQLSFDCDYPLNQIDWDKVSADGIGWNSVEDDLEWPLKPDSQFSRASGDSTAKLSVQMMCGNESVIL